MDLNYLDLLIHLATELARNIATWGYVNTHERWDILSCPIHDNVSTSKANKSLACW